MENIFQSFLNFIKEKFTTKEIIDDFFDDSENMEGYFEDKPTVNFEYAKNKSKVCGVLNCKIELLEELNNMVSNFNKTTEIINELKK